MDHVMAGIDAHFHPIDGNLENKLYDLLLDSQTFFESVESLAAVTYLGDLGGVVAQSIISGDFESAYEREMPDQDLEGDVMAVVLSRTGVLDGDQSIGEILRTVYLNGESEIYQNRYEIFADAIGIEWDEQTGQILNRGTFIPRHAEMVSGFGKGLAGRHYLEEDNLTGIHIGRLGLALQGYATDGLNNFLTWLESRLGNDQ